MSRVRCVTAPMMTSRGKRRYVTEIYVDNMEMLVSKFAASRTNEASNAQTAAKAEAQTSLEEKEQDSLPF